MINFARQAYVNPFLSGVGAPFVGVNPLTQGQQMGGFVPTPFGYLPMTQFAHYNPLAAQFAAGIIPGINPVVNPMQAGQYNPLLSQVAAGASPGINPQTSQFGQYNPLLSQIATGIPAGVNPQSAQVGPFNPLGPQFGGGFTPAVNPFVAQTLTNWPGSPHFSQQGVGDRTGAYGIDPRVAIGFGQQFGYADPNVTQSWSNPAIAGDAISSLMSNQQNPLVHQQLPIRPLVNTPQVAGFQSGFPSMASQLPQWPVAQLDPYRAFIEAQLISQLATNPLYQLQHQVQRGYGAPEASWQGLPFVAGQQFNPLYGNVPFCG